MSERSIRILSCAISLVSLVIAFVIIGRDAIFGDVPLADVDFSFFYVILVPVILLNVVQNLTTKDKK
jgi:hypothetical protein